MVRLNHYGWSVAAIAKYKDKSAHTVRASLHRWQNQGLKGLWEGGNRGRKRQWLEEDLQHLETSLEQEPRTYNAAQLAQKLAEERGVKLSADRLRKLLKKRMRPSRRRTAAGTRTKQRGGAGKEPDTHSPLSQLQNLRQLNKQI